MKASGKDLAAIFPLGPRTSGPHPSQPKQVGMIRLNNDWPKAVDVAVSGDVVLVADSGSGSEYRQYVHIIDVSSPTAPRQRSRLRIDTANIEAANGLFYIADQDGGFRIINPNSRCQAPISQDIPASFAY